MADSDPRRTRTQGHAEAQPDEQMEKKAKLEAESLPSQSSAACHRIRLRRPSPFETPLPIPSQKADDRAATGTPEEKYPGPDGQAPANRTTYHAEGDLGPNHNHSESAVHSKSLSQREVPLPQAALPCRLNSRCSEFVPLMEGLQEQSVSVTHRACHASCLDWELQLPPINTGLHWLPSRRRICISFAGP